MIIGQVEAEGRDGSYYTKYMTEVATEVMYGGVPDQCTPRPDGLGYTGLTLADVAVPRVHYGAVY